MLYFYIGSTWSGELFFLHYLKVIISSGCCCSVLLCLLVWTISVGQKLKAAFSFCHTVWQSWAAAYQTSISTDYCSSLKITDQTEHKIGCTIFCENLEDHPRIFQTGDIVRMHRVKVCRWLFSIKWKLTNSLRCILSYLDSLHMRPTPRYEL